MNTEVSLIDRVKENLPIMQHYNVDQIITKSKDDWRKGERPPFEILKWLFLAGLCYGLYLFATIILPKVFLAVGIVLAVIVSMAVVVAAYMAIPLYLRAVKGRIRKIHEKMITHDPFLEFSLQEESFVNKREIVKQGKTANTKMRNQMEADGRQAETDANDYKVKLDDLKEKIDKTGDFIAGNLIKFGDSYKEQDEYIQKTISYNKMLSESKRVGQMFKQSVNFTSMYNSRYSVLNKFSQKLDLMDADIENKLLDFRTSVELLRKEYNFVKVMKDTTQSVKSILGITEDWQLTLAFNVVRDTISTDLATISTDMDDINKISTYNIDSEELYSNLERLTKQIDSGEISIPKSQSYKNPDYKFTEQDKSNLKGFDSLLD